MPGRLLPTFTLLILAVFLTGSEEIALRSPLTTVIPIPGVPGGDQVITAVLLVPADAPTDLGVGAFVSDDDGRWFQRIQPGTLAPGRHELSFRMTGADALVSEPVRCAWTAVQAASAVKAGLFLWSARPSAARITIEQLEVAPAPPAPAPQRVALTDLRLDTVGADGIAQARAGERWSLSLLPDPLPDNPYDFKRFQVDAVVTWPSGEEQRIPGFWAQPMRHTDRGDIEEILADGAGRFHVRFRPQRPGLHRLRLEARWTFADGRTGAVDSELPAIQVAGPAFTGYVRVDATDKRFFACGDELFWPVGLNLHSVYDQRSRERLSTKLTPHRGSLAYAAMLRRLAASGANACEIWMSSWNFALEWRADWPGFHGVGRYNEMNASRFDRVLDESWANGIRINVTINNHGQASPSSDREWRQNPYSIKLGGPVADAAEWFRMPEALAYQERLRRYLVGRYADHPAVMGWKLFSEVDLSAIQRPDISREWHQNAAKRWKALDSYDHPVTTHWAGDYRRPFPEVCELPEIDYICIDAYRQPGRSNGRHLADLLRDSTVHPSGGLHRYGKPVLTTEYGCSSQGGPEANMLADQAIAGWVSLVSGHVGTAMMWWFEWVDQGEHWQAYRAIQNFVANEELRGEDAKSATLDATSPAGVLWCQAWVRRGRLLGYLLDERYAYEGDRTIRHTEAMVTIGANIKPGTVQLAWWNADDGTPLASTTIEHAGGPLVVTPPAFQRHLGFKLARAEGSPTPVAIDIR